MAMLQNQLMKNSDGAQIAFQVIADFVRQPVD